MREFGPFIFIVLVLFFAIFYGVPFLMSREKGGRTMAIMSGLLIPAGFLIGIGLFLLWVLLALARDALSL